MPALTQTLPARVNGLAVDNGIPAGLKLKKLLASQQHSSNLEEDPRGKAAPVPSSGLEDPRQATLEPSDLKKKFDTDKKEFDTALSTASSAVSKVLEDLFREAAGDNSDLINIVQNLSIKQENIFIKQGADDFNAGVRSWNASMPDRKSNLRPLKDPQQKIVFGLNVTITELEAFPDVIKAALLLHVGIEPANIAFQDLFDDTGEIDNEVLDNLRRLQHRANLTTPFDERTEIEQGFALSGAPQDYRLTQQLRAVMGLTAQPL